MAMRDDNYQQFYVFAVKTPSDIKLLDSFASKLMCKRNTMQTILVLAFIV